MVRRIKARLVLQLRAEGMTGRMIAESQGMSRKSVLAVFDAADAAGECGSLIWDRDDGLIQDHPWASRCVVTV